MVSCNSFAAASNLPTAWMSSLWRSDWWVLNLSAECVSEPEDSNMSYSSTAQRTSELSRVCVSPWMCSNAHPGWTAQMLHLSCGWKCEIQDRFTATVDKVLTDMKSPSGNTYTEANTLELCLTHTHTHKIEGERERKSQELGDEGGWQRWAPRGTNTDSYVHRPTLPASSKQILPYTQTNTHALQTNAHTVYHLSDCQIRGTNVQWG